LEITQPELAGAHLVNRDRQGPVGFTYIRVLQSQYHMAPFTERSLAAFIATILAITMARAMHNANHMHTAGGTCTHSGTTRRDPAGTKNEYKILDSLYDAERRSWTYLESASAGKKVRAHV
jgi:hypothetical protein